jgi:hypothetical protein
MNIEKNSKGLFIDGEQVKFAHFRVITQGVDPCGGATVAYIGDKETIKAAGIAYCSDYDNFVYAYGRTKAIGRLVQGLTNNATGDDGVEESSDPALPKFIREWERQEVEAQMDVLGYQRW